MGDDVKIDWRKELEFWIKVYDICRYVCVGKCCINFIKDRIARSLEGLMQTEVATDSNVTLVTQEDL